METEDFCSQLDKVVESGSERMLDDLEYNQEVPGTSKDEVRVAMKRMKSGKVVLRIREMCRAAVTTGT